MIRALNGLDPDPARHFVRPDLGPDCLHRLSADDTSMQRVNKVLFVLFDLIIHVPVNNFSVMSGRVFLG